MIGRNFLALSVLAGVLLAPRPASADTSTNLEEEVRLLREQNALLQQQVQKQGGELDSLAREVQALEAAKANGDGAGGAGDAPAKGGFNLGNVSLSGEGGVGYFSTGSQGFAPHSQLRVDEARLFAEAPIWNEVYFLGEADLATRENPDTRMYVGELYLDFQDASQLWGRDSQLNVRAGRINIPFGEEYMNRYAMENPLISHSLADIWGYDPGAELYGSLGKFNYVAAVQEGTYANYVQRFDGSVSVAGRFGFDPNPHWHFSLSGMRTGNLPAQSGAFSAAWFGNGFFRSIGSPATTKFHADLFEGDVTARWKTGHVSGFGGVARYGDNDPAADNGRDLYYYSAEVEQNLPRKFYTAARFSQIFAADGYPLVGFGNFGNYFLSEQATELWRLSLGIGYRFSNNLGVKAEYSFERGEDLDGEQRDGENFIGTEAVFKF